MPGKNFSCNNVGQRKKSDFYETPYSLTWQLLDNEDFSGCKTLLEPCCGNGAIIAGFQRHLNPWPTVMAYDILDSGIDFLQETRKFDGIITNPPFSLAKEFILKAKEVATQKFAFLLPLSYLHGEARYKEIYQDEKFPLTTVYVFTRYPMLGDPLRQDGKYRTGMMVYAWYVWDKTVLYDRPNIRWISNQQYILNKKDKEVDNAID